MYRVWDRKSSRHNWQIVCERSTEEDAQLLAKYQFNKIKNWGKWGDKWEVGYDFLRPEEDTDYLVSSLPRNHPMIEIFRP